MMKKHKELQTNETKAKRRKKGEGTWGKKTIKGSKYHYYKKEYNGKEKYFYGKTIQEVKDKRDLFESKPINAVKKEIAKQVLSEYLFSWLEYQKKPDIREQSYDILYKAVKYQLLPYSLANIQMGNLDKEIIQKHFNTLAEQYAKSTIDKLYNVMVEALEYAKKSNQITLNPMYDVNRPTESAVLVKKKKIKFLEPEDMELLYQEAYRQNIKGFCINGKEGTPVYGQYAWLIILILYTGMRIGEALALQWRNVDLKNKEINIDQTLVTILNKEYEYDEINDDYTPKKKQNKTKIIINEPKTENGIRTILLVERAITALQELEKLKPNHKSTDFICRTNNNNVPSNSNITRTLNCMLTRANCKVEKLGLHGLRHSYASLLILGGIKVKLVSEMLGHADVRTTENIYVHIIKKQKIRANETVNQFIKLNKAIAESTLLDDNIEIVENKESNIIQFNNIRRV